MSSTDYYLDYYIKFKIFLFVAMFPFIYYGLKNDKHLYKFLLCYIVFGSLSIYANVYAYKQTQIFMNENEYARTHKKMFFAFAIAILIAINYRRFYR